jgi:UDP-N-acetylmuramoyl-tripeptide--D-alanyl-D-alanine ligase
MSFLGEHNALNATAAFALGRALGYSGEECAAGLETARPYARRLNLLDAPGGVTVLDDCYNANTFSVVAALDTVEHLARAQNGRAVAVLGDMLELGPGELDEHRKVGERVRTAVALAAFFGPRSRATHQAARIGAHFTEIDPLLAWLRPQLRQGDVVLVKGSRGMRLERVVEALSGGTPGGAH